MQIFDQQFTLNRGNSKKKKKKTMVFASSSYNEPHCRTNYTLIYLLDINEGGIESGKLIKDRRR